MASNVSPNPRAGDMTVEEMASRRILVVDDNSDAADSLAMLLRLLGNEVRTSYNGRTALQLAREFLPDIIFLDLAMPGMSGFEVAQHLRSSEESRSTVLVAMTGFAQDADRCRSREVGFDDHLVKPTDSRMLAAVLRKPR